MELTGPTKMGCSPSVYNGTSRFFTDHLSIEAVRSRRLPDFLMRRESKVREKMVELGSDAKKLCVGSEKVSMGRNRILLIAGAAVVALFIAYSLAPEGLVPR